ncbi:neuroplastin [Condylostylus longicornis]|uniref:neuroplastin n=1 Tax=Condylostylus longicornis TaxID=2530218 RepID=UPI00244DD7AE|nr:neuroplastin [Condylostylus longicornis]
MALKENFISLILLFIVTVNAELVPNYDNVERELKVYDIKSPLVLSCNNTNGDSSDLTWEKDGIEVSKVDSIKDRFRIIAAENKFIIERTNENDNGTYTCSANGERKNITVVANVVVRVPSNVNVVEGEKLTIHCTAVGTDAKIVWQNGNSTITNTTDKFIVQDDETGVENAILMIDNVSLEDAGEYKCIAKNAATESGIKREATDTSMVRVKGKLAALWPFLGICAEVFVLCAIILIYEKRRNKTELEESDTDNNDPKKKRRNYD